jgi:hypothetical protein
MNTTPQFKEDNELLCNSSSCSFYIEDTTVPNVNKHVQDSEETIVNRINLKSVSEFDENAFRKAKLFVKINETGYLSLSDDSESSDDDINSAQDLQIHRKCLSSKSAAKNHRAKTYFTGITPYNCSIYQDKCDAESLQKAAYSIPTAIMKEINEMTSPQNYSTIDSSTPQQDQRSHV